MPTHEHIGRHEHRGHLLEHPRPGLQTSWTSWTPETQANADRIWLMLQLVAPTNSRPLRLQKGGLGGLSLRDHLHHPRRGGDLGNLRSRVLARPCHNHVNLRAPDRRFG